MTHASFQDMVDHQEPELIDFHDRSLLRRLTRSLGCSVRQLRMAVELVGPRIANVRMRFRRRPMIAHHPREH